MSPKQLAYAGLGLLVLGILAGARFGSEPAHVEVKTVEKIKVVTRDVPGSLPADCIEVVNRLPALLASMENASHGAGSAYDLLSEAGIAIADESVPAVNEVVLKFRQAKELIENSTTDSGEAYELIDIYMKRCLAEMPSDRSE